MKETGPHNHSHSLQRIPTTIYGLEMVRGTAIWKTRGHEGYDHITRLDPEKTAHVHPHMPFIFGNNYNVTPPSSTVNVFSAPYDRFVLICADDSAFHLKDCGWTAELRRILVLTEILSFVPNALDFMQWTF